MTWSRGEKTLVCEHCGTAHIASYVDVPVREKGEQACLNPACGKQLIRWNGSRDYLDFRLAEGSVR